jgi:hypothetical protein
MRRCPAQLVAGAGLVAFAAIIGLEHVLQSDLDPVTHEVSEYVHGSGGWLMVGGFLAWAVSLAATAIAAREAGPRPRLLRRGAVAFLGIAAGGMLVTACFATQTSAGMLPPGVRLGTAGRLHDVGSGVATLSLVAAAAMTIPDSTVSSGYRVRTAAILLAASAADVALLLIGPAVGGLRQRILLACGLVWQATALQAWRTTRATP